MTERRLRTNISAPEDGRTPAAHLKNPCLSVFIRG